MAKKKKSQKPPSLRDSDLKLLDDVARWRLTYRDATSKLRFSGKECGHVLSKLTEAELLESHYRELPGNLSYWTITEKGTRFINVTAERSREIQGETLGKAISILTWCLKAPERAAEYHHQVRKLVGEKACPAANVTHVSANNVAVCPETNRSYAALFRTYHPAPGTSATAVARSVRDRFDKLQTGPLAKWVTDRDYGLLVLVERASEQADISRELKRLGVTDSALVVVDTAPRSETLAKYLRAKRKKQ